MCILFWLCASPAQAEDTDDFHYRKNVINRTLDEYERSYSYDRRQKTENYDSSSWPRWSNSTDALPEYNPYPYASESPEQNPWAESSASGERENSGYAYGEEDEEWYSRPYTGSDNDLPGWLDTFAYGLSVGTDQKPRYYFEGLIPIREKLDSDGGQHMYFTQTRITGYSELQKSYSFGLGYRKLTADKTMILGFNSFIDYKQHRRHYRTGYGLEFLSADLDMRFNYYLAHSDPRDYGTLSEAAVDGYDLEFGFDVPYVNKLKIYGGYQHYFYKESRDPKGMKMRLQYSPWPYLISNFEIIDRDDDDVYYSLDTRVTMAFFDYPGEDEGFFKTENYDTFGFLEEDVSHRFYDRVERNFNIELETRNRAPSTGNQIGNLQTVQMVSYFTGTPRACGTCLDNNSNGIVDPGDGFEIDFLLTNNTSETSTGISFSNATVSTGWSFEFNTSASLPDAPPGGTSRTGDSTDVDLVIPGGTANGTTFYISADFTADGETENLTFGPFVVGSITHDQVFNSQ